LKHIKKERYYTIWCVQTLDLLYFFHHVNRAIWKDLEDAGFSEIKLMHIEALMIKPHIACGYAVK
uniref:Uncharacterized protein n=1 Tax=Oncorhynchus tshawytscha TaxID=74940 RepID=A0A8C8I4J1_ONCTS